MYESFFGLKEKPFNMTPDPEYLFFTNQHREAFAHLVYGIRERRGFIQITGEVGAGKTTLCRAILNEFDQNTRIALILNPMLSDVELLRAINDELFIESPGESKKELLDSLNAYLIEQHSAGKNVVLLIDEAQNLSDETLEQIRIISNLETVKDKLIQIVLVGQPELGEKLDKQGLRQLNQRITVRYHLTSLGRKETEDYIAHRLKVAGSDGEIQFTKGALREIHRVSQGVPRKINTVCDHALLTAFVREIPQIDREIVRKAWQEIEGPRPRKRKRLVPRWALPAGAAVATGLLLASTAMLVARNRAWLFQRFDAKPTVRLASVDPVPPIDEQPMTTEEVVAPASSTPAPEEPPPVVEQTQPDVEQASEGEGPVEVAYAPQEPPVTIPEPAELSTEEEESVAAEVVPETAVETEPAGTPVPASEPETETSVTAEKPGTRAGAIWAAMTGVDTDTGVSTDTSEEEKTPESPQQAQLHDVQLEVVELPTPEPAAHATTEAYGDGEFDGHGVLHTGVSERNNVASLLTLAFRWHPEEFPIYQAYRSILEEETDLETALGEMGLELREVKVDLGRMCLLDLPAAVELKESLEQPAFAAVVLDANLETLLVSIPSNGERKFSRSELEGVWTGRAWLCVPYGETEHKVVGPDATGPVVKVMESRLSQLGFHELAPDDRYDKYTEAAVKAFQERYGLEVNGVADPETQLLLFSLTSESGIPSLNSQLASGNR